MWQVNLWTLSAITVLLMQGGTGVNQHCRGEDGYFKCLDGIGCFHRLMVVDGVVHCNDGSDEIDPLNCSDKETRDRLTERCISRDEFAQILSLFTSCPKTEFLCPKSKSCIERSKIMDGTNNCGISYVEDQSDEEAPLPFCLNNEFSCSGDNDNNSQRCIPREWVKDGYNDCPQSGLDERVVLGECFDEVEFSCESGRCIPRYRVRDKYQDCRNGLDERTTLKCYEHLEFTCNDSGRCIPRSWRGNNVADCSDGSDETPLLSSETCRAGEVRCDNNRRCIPESFLCDGIDQCGDCSDEIENCIEPKMFRCPNDPDRKCIHWEYSCDGVINCPNNTDDITSIVGFKCFRNSAASNQKRYCVIPQWSLNDDVSLCDDRSDICFINGTFVCERCLDNTVITSNQLCDGIFDCPDLSDECLCDKNFAQSMESQLLCANVCYGDDSNVCQQCEIGYVFCPEDNVCLERKKICDGTIDCVYSGFDEKFCSKTFHIESTISTSAFQCDVAPDILFELLEHFKFDQILALAKGSKRANRCDGITECLTFEDECSDRANCSVKPKVCDEIPLVKTDVSDVGIYWNQIFGLSNRSFDSFEARKCEQIIEYVFGKSICNGILECESGLDEKHCPKRFQCDAGEVSGFSYKPLPIVSIPYEKVCDGFIDCSNATDEMDCPESTHFYCIKGDKLFVSTKKVLNGIADCDDESDECPEYYLSDSPISSNKFLIVSTALEFFLWLMVILALSGNGAVIMTNTHFILSASRKGPTQKPTPSLMINKLLILNLAVADFLMGIALLIIIVKTREYSGDYCLRDKAWRTSSTCSAVGVITVLSSEVSVFTLVCLTSYRLYHIVYPYRSREASTSLSGIWITSTWVISLIIAIAPLLRPFSQSVITGMWIKQNKFYFSDVADFPSLKQFAQRFNTINNLSALNQGVYQDWYTLQNFFENDITGEAPIARGYFGYYSASGLCIPRFYKTVNEDSDLNALSPTVIIFNFVALVYIAMAYAVIYRRTTSHRLVGEGQRTDQQRKQARTLQRKVTILIATDMICWLPICIMTFVSVGGVALPPEAYAVTAILLLPINSSINPLIYTDAFPKAWAHLQSIIEATKKRRLLSRPVNINTAGQTLPGAKISAETDVKESSI